MLIFSMLPWWKASKRCTKRWFILSAMPQLQTVFSIWTRSINAWKHILLWKEKAPTIPLYNVSCTSWETDCGQLLLALLAWQSNLMNPNGGAHRRSKLWKLEKGVYIEAIWVLPLRWPKIKSSAKFIKSVALLWHNTSDLFSPPVQQWDHKWGDQLFSFVGPSVGT